MGKGGHSLEGAYATYMARKPQAVATDGIEQEWREGANGTNVLCVKDVFTREEVAKHNTKDDCWLIIHNKVYDVTAWIDNHPGGYLPLVNVAGKDATDNFSAYHPAYVWAKKLPFMQIGQLVDEDAAVSPFVAEFRKMQQALLSAGFHQTQYSYYMKLGLWLALLFGTMLYLTVGCTSMWAHMAGAVMLGFFFQQLAFVGHDLGHNGISHSVKIDSSVGLIAGNLLSGISMGWWKWSHNTHHNVCNSVEHDPDIQYLPLLAPNKEMVDAPFYSSFHQKMFSVDTPLRFVLKYQHWLFFPIMAVARLNLYAQSFIFIYTTKVPTVNKLLETLCEVVFFTWLFALISFLPSWEERLAFFFLSHAVTAILHVQICLSHFPMTAYHGHAMTGADADSWFVLQVATSMDIEHPWYMEWFHGGLQYQVEHHLFPRIPRHNLKLVRPLVQAFCKKHGITYTSMGFLDANKLMVKRLAEAGAVAASPPRGGAPLVSASEAFKRTTLWEGFNAIG